MTKISSSDLAKMYQGQAVDVESVRQGCDTATAELVKEAGGPLPDIARRHRP